MSTEYLDAQYARCAKLASEAQHMASAAAFMGGSNHHLTSRRDRLLAALRKAALAKASGDDAQILAAATELESVGDETIA